MSEVWVAWMTIPMNGAPVPGVPLRVFDTLDGAKKFVDERSGTFTLFEEIHMGSFVMTDWVIAKGETIDG